MERQIEELRKEQSTKVNLSKPTKQTFKKDNKKCFVGGFNPNCTRDEVHEFFSEFGSIKKLILPFDKVRVQIKGYAIIEFTDSESCETLISIDEPLFLRGTKLTIKPFCKQPKASKKSRESQNNKIYIGGFPKLTTEFEIREFLEKFGKVKNLSMQHSFHNQRKVFKGFIFVIMEEKASAKVILNQTPLLFKRRKLKAARAMSRLEIEEHNQKKRVDAGRQLNDSIKLKDEHHEHSMSNLRLNISDKGSRATLIQINQMVQPFLDDRFCFSQSENSGFSLCIMNPFSVKSFQSINDKLRLMEKIIEGKPQASNVILLNRDYFGKKRFWR